MERAIYFSADATIAVFQPGDGTKYEFLWCNAGPGYTHVASIGVVRFDGYQYKQQEILICYDRCRLNDDDLPIDEFLGYVESHSKCNPWTAWAMVQCLAERWISNQLEDKR